MEQWKKGDKVQLTLATGRIKLGTLLDVDDNFGKYASNPWIEIVGANGKTYSTQKTLMAVSCRACLFA